MPVDRSGRRAARIAKVVVDVTWWAGLVLACVLVAVFLAAPALERTGVVATFEWNRFSVDAGHGLPRSVVRLAVDDSLVAIAAIQTVNDGTMAKTERREAQIEIATRRWGLFYSANAPTVAMVLAILGMVFVVRAFLAAVLSGEVFTTENGRRLAILGWMLVAIGIAGPHLERLRAWMFLDTIRASGDSLAPARADGNGLWLVGVLVLVLAAAWRYGCDLQAERDLTV